MASRSARRDILEIRHSSLYAPRDFDISPYFEVVKPTILFGFDYKHMHWADLPLPPAAGGAPPPRSLAGAKTRERKRPRKNGNGAKARNGRNGTAAPPDRAPRPAR
jgi:hypothetical protein